MRDSSGGDRPGHRGPRPRQVSHMVSGTISPASANPAMTSVNQCRSHQIMAAPTRAPSAAAVLSAIRRAGLPGSGVSSSAART